MGLLDRFRKSAPTTVGEASPALARAPRVPVELPPDVLRDAEECFQTNRDTGSCTRGRGSAVLMSVAGTSHRQEAVEAVVDGRGGSAAVLGTNVAAVFLRDPDNEHDRNAIRILVDGIHIGFVPARDAAQFQPLLKECERRQVTLVGSVRLLGDDGEPWCAGLQIRPNLDGWDLPKRKKAAPKAKAAPPPPRASALLQGDDLTRVQDGLAQLVWLMPDLRVGYQDPARTKQRAGLMVKRVRELIPALEGHAEALEAVDQQRGDLFTAMVEELESYLEDLLEAEDADEREDASLELILALEEVHGALQNGKTDTAPA